MIQKTMMEKIKNEAAYRNALKRIDQLLMQGIESKELEKLSNLVADYEDENYEIPMPSLVDVIRLRMYEMGLKQKDLAALLNTSTSRVSEYLKGKREVTLDVARQLHKKLNIDGDIILQ